MGADAQSIKALLEERRGTAAAAHRKGASGFATCTALTAAMDEAIVSAFTSLINSSARHIGVLALGGYGRRELFPKSDVDIMVLCSSGAEKETAAAAAKDFLHLLWDAGVDVGHSVRTIDEAMDLQGHSLDAWTSMIESRYLCGNRELAEEFYGRLRNRLAKGPDTWFIEGVFADLQSRYERYGNSVKLLEPNIKKSAGGLRDVHALFWLTRAADPGMLNDGAAGGPATPTFLNSLRNTGVLAEDEHDAALRAILFLFRVRHEMHFLRESLHDTLEYALQVKVAEGIGYADPAGTDDARPAEGNAVEIFMRDYYLHARTLHRLTRGLTVQFREVIEGGGHVGAAGKVVRGMFLIKDGVITIEPSVQRFTDASDVMTAFVLAAENNAEPDFRLRGAIGRSAELLTGDFPQSAATASAIRRILGSRRVATTLQEMNDLNVLGRCIPEFGELVAFFQHNVYHYFTADEHTLIAVGNAERLREQGGILHEVYRTLRRKDVLYLAVLLHDIAKPHGVADHEITGIEMARTILHRLGMDELFPDVSFLVRSHLLMEQIAFRRNVHDPATIRDFSAKFERPELLDYLYVLTYADLSAVNPGVWTEWKAAILQELYQRASEVLRRDLRGEQIDRYHEERKVETAEMVVDALSSSLPRAEIERHLRAMQSDAYLSLFTHEEIEQHIRKSALNEPVSTVFTHAEGYTEATIIAADAPFALSKFCAVLAANDATIFDANVFTRSDGVIIDRFRVSDAATRQQLQGRVCMKIAEDLAQVMGGKLDIGRLFQGHRRKWKRRPKLPPNPNIRTDVEFEDNPKFTIIDVYAPDAVGFLFRVTETISRLGLDIYFAKIATRGDGIVDAFYVLDREGKPVKGRLRREGIRTEILATIQKIAEEELSS